MSALSLTDYQRAEREESITQARIGIGVHAAVTVLVCAIVVMNA
jgi:hypothetical protein